MVISVKNIEDRLRKQNKRTVQVAMLALTALAGLFACLRVIGGWNQSSRLLNDDPSALSNTAIAVVIVSGAMLASWRYISRKHDINKIAEESPIFLRAEFVDALENASDDMRLSFQKRLSRNSLSRCLLYILIVISFALDSITYSAALIGAYWAVLMALSIAIYAVTERDKR